MSEYPGFLSKYPGFFYYSPTMVSKHFSSPPPPRVSVVPGWRGILNAGYPGFFSLLTYNGNIGSSCIKSFKITRYTCIQPTVTNSSITDSIRKIPIALQSHNTFLPQNYWLRESCGGARQCNVASFQCFNKRPDFCFYGNWS